MFREDQEVTRDLPDLLGPEDSLDHPAHLARTVLVGNTVEFHLPSLISKYCQTDLLETKVSRVKQEARGCLACRGKKGRLVTRERKAMEVCLAFLEPRVFVEREAVLELQDFQVQKDRKENPLL